MKSGVVQFVNGEVEVDAVYIVDALFLRKTIFRFYFQSDLMNKKIIFMLFLIL